MKDEEGKPVYGAFNEATGKPTQTGQGEPLNKSQIKKVEKLFSVQQKKYEKAMMMTPNSSNLK
jgi:hypothetical protein